MFAPISMKPIVSYVFGSLFVFHSDESNDANTSKIIEVRQFQSRPAVCSLAVLQFNFPFIDCFGHSKTRQKNL